MQPITVSVRDAAAAIGIGRTTLFNLIKRGQLDVVRIGRRTLVKVDSINRLVGDHGQRVHDVVLGARR